MTGAPGAPAPPPAAGTVFGDRLGVLEAYAGLLATSGVERGLIGPREPPRLWDRHLLNCAGLTELVPAGAQVADLGSGAGLPGLVLAAQRPDLDVVLIEPLLRRSDFLLEAVALLGLANVQVRRARAEDLAGELRVDAVVARAVAALDVLAGWALPLLRPGGRLLALKGERGAAELAAARPDLAAAGAVVSEDTPHVVEVGRQDLTTWARIVVVERSDRPVSRPLGAPSPPRRARPGGPSGDGQPRTARGGGRGVANGTPTRSAAAARSSTSRKSPRTTPGNAGPSARTT